MPTTVLIKDRKYSILVFIKDRISSIIAQKLGVALEREWRPTTRRDACLSGVADKIHVVIGMRRSGKTCFLFQCLRDRLEAGVSRDRLIYLNFEDERLAGIQAEDLGAVLDEYYRQFPHYRQKERVTFCFDEIQVVSGWESFVRRIHDEENVELILSGSSAKMLSREVATSMRGRAMERVITPFSFPEFLRHRGLDLPANGRLVSSREESFYRAAFDEFREVGGFPEVTNCEAVYDRIPLLQQYVDAVLFRDIVERHGVTNVTALRALVRTLLRNPATLMSVSKIHRDFQSQGVKASKETLLEMLGHLEDCFLVQPISLHSESERKRTINPRKLYLADHTLSTSVSARVMQDVGQHLENMVACELQRRMRSLCYYKTHAGHEVDFFAQSFAGEETLVQVSAHLFDEGTRTRELRALAEASHKRPEAKLLMLVDQGEEYTERTDQGREIEVRLIWRWMLGV